MSEEVITYLGALVVRLLGEGEPLADVGDVDEAGRALHEAGVARVRRARPVDDGAAVLHARHSPVPVVVAGGDVAHPGAGLPRVDAVPALVPE